MQQTTGLLQKIKHHDQLPIMVNENCAIALPEEVLPTLLQPHQLAYYYFVFVDRGSQSVAIDGQDITIADSQVAFGLPNQLFAQLASDKSAQQYKFGFDENALALLPQTYPFLINPFSTNVITFDSAAKERVKASQHRYYFSPSKRPAHRIQQRLF